MSLSSNAHTDLRFSRLNYIIQFTNQLIYFFQVVYLGDTGRLFTTGFSKFSDRQFGVWSQHDLSSPLQMDAVDSSSGVLFPFYGEKIRSE